MKIAYRVATTANDYEACRRLMASASIEKNDLGFPTLMAIDERGLLGFIGTTPRNDMVLAGPLVMRQDGHHAIRAFRLTIMYEMTLKNLGISSFVFYARKDDSAFAKVMTKYFPDVKPYAEHEGVLLYSWHIDKMRESLIGA